jgi:hypothetical protein
MGEKHGRRILLTKHLFHARKVLLHAINLRHGTDGFTSPPKEVVLWIFITLKIHRPRPGLNPQTLGPVASTLLLDHRGRLVVISKVKKNFFVLHCNLSYCILLLLDVTEYWFV